ncbi:hypothetical protein HELRODRAFT_169378 [Helobdella robusta]|uniref:Phosphatidylinositol-specific phospholipase C X domain-containing protein n=1 Tax=Helobdella robusta TaxID=6412 RepID=T1F1V5_HELRO|nr:hypothetical protein HELRODRAFT_169378 [Helobdella robusta]ESO08517.1 hypothetical protein HELRODRAFT_169378 [Helobdella robusta]
MITIEEIIISSLYHRLVLVRIKKTSDIKNKNHSKSNNEDEDDGPKSVIEKCKTGNVITNKGLGHLYLGQCGANVENSKSLEALEDTRCPLPSPGHESIDTISLETNPAKLRQHNINIVDEEIFIKNQIGRIIEIGELHLMTRRSKTTAEVQTDFEPIWCFNKDGGPVKSLQSQDSLIDLANCKEFSLVRLESLEQPEKRSLLVINSELKKEEANDEKTNNLYSGSYEEFNKTKIYNTALAESYVNESTDTRNKNSCGATSSLINDNSLVGSYKTFNITDQGEAVLVNEEKCTGSIHDHVKKEDNMNMVELGGISDVLKPTSFVKFVVNRVEADSYIPTSLISANSNKQSSSITPPPAEVDFSELKFRTMQESSQILKNRHSLSGGMFKERRRLSQKRSRSLRRHHGGMLVDGEKLLRHIMSFGVGEKLNNNNNHQNFVKSSPSGRFADGSNQPARDIITVTDFKLSPMHPLRSLNSSQIDLRRDRDHEFATPVHNIINRDCTDNNHSNCNSNHVPPQMKLDRKSRSERSSPLMMTATFISEDINASDNKNQESDVNNQENNTTFSDMLWNAKIELPNSASGSLPDDCSTTTIETSSTATSQSSVVQFERFPDWMKKLPNKHKNLPLTKLCIPGSHICLAIDRDMRTSMDFSKCNYEMAEFLRKLPNLPVFNGFRSQMKHIWKAWMPKQYLSVYEQLQAGSRYLDMRITKQLGTLYGEHGLYTGQLKRYLKEVRLFLEEQPQEVVIIHLTPSYFVEPPDKKHLVTMLFQVFGTKMACWDKQGHEMRSCDSCRAGHDCIDSKFHTSFIFPSINQLLRSGKQAIIIMPTEDVYNHVRNHIFGGSIWPDNHISVSMPKKQSLDELRLFLDDCYCNCFAENSENGRTNCLKVMRAVLSPDMSMVFGRYDKRRNMKELSFLDTCPLICEWLAADGGKCKLNVVAVDFIGAPGLVRSVLDLNREEKMATMMMMMMVAGLV